MSRSLPLWIQCLRASNLGESLPLKLGQARFKDSAGLANFVASDGMFQRVAAIRADNFLSALKPKDFPGAHALPFWPGPKAIGLRASRVTAQQPWKACRRKTGALKTALRRSLSKLSTSEARGLPVPSLSKSAGPSDRVLLPQGPHKRKLWLFIVGCN
jgi:hypothetical protein